MSQTTQQTLIHEAIAALQRFDRRGAAALIKRYMRENRSPGERWKSISTLADKIGEIELAVEAMRRYANSDPRTLEKTLQYCSELATRGRVKECRREIAKLPQHVKDHTSVTHLRATLATQAGDFAEAEPLIRKTIDEAELTGQNWLGLSMIKKFALGDPDIARMEKLRQSIDRGPPESQASFFYALGKAYHDAKEFDRAFDAYECGASVKRQIDAFNAEALEAFTRDVIRDFTPATLATLKPSKKKGSRAIFVTGLPRSGTTLVEQILTSHSKVENGAEANLFRAALFPAGDYSLKGARAYDGRDPANDDPWGDVARDYEQMLSMRFGPRGLIVDKTLNHSRFMGLILHALPDAKVVWLRRNPEDNAISVFRNYFSSPLPWSWSLEDIGRYFRNDDALHAHWTQVFPDRILTVRYEELVSDPTTLIPQILDHAGLEFEGAALSPHEQKGRAVLTASVAQVREPISAKQVGAAKAYADQMTAFRSAYLSD